MLTILTRQLDMKTYDDDHFEDVFSCLGQLVSFLDEFCLYNVRVLRLLFLVTLNSLEICMINCTFHKFIVLYDVRLKTNCFIFVSKTSHNLSQLKRLSIQIIY